VCACLPGDITDIVVATKIALEELLQIAVLRMANCRKCAALRSAYERAAAAQFAG
jgi:hypothetical protein